MRRLVINSGGLDSAVALALARLDGKAELHSLYIDIGSRQAVRERSRAIAQADAQRAQHHIAELECPWLREHDLFSPDVFFVSTKIERFAAMPKNLRSFVVPMRNLMFLSVAASCATGIGAEEVWIGFDYRGADKADTSPSWDKRPEFVEAFSRTLSECNEWAPFKIVSPLQGNTKDCTILRGAELGVDFAQTWTCYNDLPLSCGVCPACVERKRGFESAGIKDSIKYASKAMLRTYVDLEA